VIRSAKPIFFESLNEDFWLTLESENSPRGMDAAASAPHSRLNSDDLYK
jgi:hypothetical protein